MGNRRARPRSLHLRPVGSTNFVRWLADDAGATAHHSRAAGACQQLCTCSSNCTSSMHNVRADRSNARPRGLPHTFVVEGNWSEGGPGSGLTFRHAFGFAADVLIWAQRHCSRGTRGSLGSALAPFQLEASGMMRIYPGSGLWLRADASLCNERSALTGAQERVLVPVRQEIAVDSGKVAVGQTVEAKAGIELQTASLVGHLKQ